MPDNRTERERNNDQAVRIYRQECIALLKLWQGKRIESGELISQLARIGFDLVERYKRE